MTVNGSSTVIIFSSKGFAGKNQKVRATPSEAKCFKCFGHKFAKEGEVLQSRIKILEYFAGF